MPQTVIEGLQKIENPQYMDYQDIEKQFGGLWAIISNLKDGPMFTIAGGCVRYVIDPKIDNFRSLIYRKMTELRPFIKRDALGKCVVMYVHPW